MRIISGFLKGKRIDFLKSSTTRPLRDFVKESAFNLIKHSNLINISLEDSRVLDFYSGIGSFGIECISRGAKEITFVENDIMALITLKKNIENLKIQNKTKIFEKKVVLFLKQFNQKNKYEIIFLDPPFSEKFYVEELKIIKELNIVKKNHIIIIHREDKTTDDLTGILDIVMIKKYGRSKVIFGKFKLDGV
jgi:16S rRNA (guanine966-N2)-methyltransferase|tara:strand:- start:333 stop:908 length:576 start_codon:yes stop_codon:yes gene_type:complete